MQQELVEPTNAELKQQLDEMRQMLADIVEVVEKYLPLLERYGNSRIAQALSARRERTTG